MSASDTQVMYAPHASQFPEHACMYSLLYSRVLPQAHACTRDSTAKMQLVRSLSTHICSFTASLHSTNLLTFTKRSHASAHDRMCEYSRPSLQGKCRVLEACLSLVVLLMPLFAQQTHQCSLKSLMSTSTVCCLDLAPFC